MAFLDNNGLTRYDGKLKDLLARKTIISGVESTATASKAYAAGEYFVLNDVLYKVTAAIASGGTITPGTNCTATDVSAELGTLKDSLTGLQNIIGNYNNAGFHNSIFRGKFLGTSFTTTQHNVIVAGTFDDLFIGDYWTINSTDYVIVHFDYYLRCSDSDINYHHIVVMPRTNLNLSGYIDTTALINTTNAGVTVSSQETVSAFKWNATMAAPNANSTAGGYIGSRMRTVIMPACDAKVKADFGSAYVKTVSMLYPSAFYSESDGRATGWAWTATDLACDLCNETQVYGQQVWGTGAEGKPGYEVGIDKWQFAIFAVHPAFANLRANWWLRSVDSSANAALVILGGNASGHGSATAYGVRPRFLLS